MSANHQVLIVDDEPLNVKLFAAILSSDNYEIIKAYNGEEALKKVTDESPDLILLDIMMPGIDGFEVTRRLKRDSETRDIPIILITAFDVADYKVIGHEAGADEFLNKPVKAPELKARVKSLLSTKEYQAELKLQKQAEAAGNGKKVIPAVNEVSSVLLVFEDENEAESIKMLLHGQPCEVMIEKTAKDAIAHSTQRKIDLILLDAMLHDEGCFEICSRLKESSQTANSQILVVADSVCFESKHQQFDLWTDDFLIQPINVHELRSRVKALLKKKTFLDRLYSSPEGSVSSAITDSLSGLANYSFFNYFLGHEIKRALRDNKPIALIMMELNDVNSNPSHLGHLAGEELLKNLGTIIQANIRDVDLGARYKEKQFALVLVNTDGIGAGKVAQRLKDLIINQLSESSDKSPAKSPRLNIGFAVFPSDADSMDLLIQQAEKELIASKNNIHPPVLEGN